MLHTDRRTLQNAVRNILDGELLNKYLYLSTMERSELAKKIGTTADIVSFILKKKNHTPPQHSNCTPLTCVISLRSSLADSGGSAGD